MTAMTTNTAKKTGPYELDIILFHTPTGRAYAALRRGTQQQVYAIHSKALRNVLRKAHRDRYGTGIKKKALRELVEDLEDEAICEGPEAEVYTRVAMHDGAVYIDLGNASYKAVEVSPGNGYRLVDTPPVYFIRPTGLGAMQEPIPGGSIDDIGEFLHLPDDRDFRLVVVWMLKALLPLGPTPILAAIGRPDSCKSSFTAVIRKLIDPNAAGLRALPPSERELLISAGRAHLMSFDNLSTITDDMADACCRLVTGGGSSYRALYTDAEEIIFNTMRPILLNGVTEPTDRGDFWDRSINIHVPLIPDAERIITSDFWVRFEAAAPRIVGALLTTLSRAMARLPSVTKTNLPRMADFVRLGIATEEVLGWPSGSFMDAFRRNREEADHCLLEGVPVGAALLAMLTKYVGAPWEGTAMDLLKELPKHVPDDLLRGPRDWPDSPRGLRGQLDRMSHSLRRIGVECEWLPRRATERLVRLQWPTGPRPGIGRLPSCLQVPGLVTA
ncbi:MAG: hypothetical protein NTV86_04705 [Planctomycetota bacterium]|nr:hypothetical protein [Planctomycetota bacterium]